MKMEKTGEVMFNSEVRAEDSKVPAKDIGREFVRHYYTMLSEKPQEAGRFYSHESYFMHNDMPEVCGTDDIQKAIQQLNFQDCKARIYSITGTNTVNNGLVLLVLGELALKGCTKRRFCQTFVLYPQSAKKFYVHDDVFQYIDKAFGETSPAPKLETEEPDVAFSHDQQVNGHKAASLVENVTIDGPGDVTETTRDHEVAPMPHEDHSTHTPPEIVEETAKTESPLAAKEVETKTQDTGPRTWAKMAAKSVPLKPSSAAPTPPAIHQPAAPSQPRPPPAKPSNFSDNRRHDDRGRDDRGNRPANRERGYQQRDNGNRGRGGVQRSELTLFVSNIAKYDPSINWDLLESELRTTFEKLGKVSSVSIPKTVKDGSNQPKGVYAFVDMDSQKDIDQVFKGCRLDEHQRTYLAVDLPVVNYVGEVNISNRKDDERGGGGSQQNRSFENKGGRGNFGGGGGIRRGGAGFSNRQRQSEDRIGDHK